MLNIIIQLISKIRKLTQVLSSLNSSTNEQNLYQGTSFSNQTSRRLCVPKIDYASLPNFNNKHRSETLALLTLLGNYNYEILQKP